jgi:hypothetical protein
VRRLLEVDFVCTRIDTTGDPTAGGSFFHAPDDPPGQCLRGNGEHNVQMLFLTPRGEIFHALTGYVPPRELAAELKFALATFAELRGAGEHNTKVVAIENAHAGFLREAGFAQEEIDRADDPLGGLGELARNGFAGGNVTEAFKSFERQRMLHDHRWAMRHAMEPLSDFQPESLVGSGQSFFGSSSSGNVPPGLLGGE